MRTANVRVTAGADPGEGVEELIASLDVVILARVWRPFSFL
jgi:hypothetical protein